MEDINFDKYDEPRLHMERLLQERLIEFGTIPLRTLIMLESAGIKTLGDLTRQTRRSLHAIPQVGALTIERLEAFLEYHMLSLAKED